MVPACVRNYTLVHIVNIKVRINFILMLISYMENIFKTVILTLMNIFKQMNVGTMAIAGNMVNVLTSMLLLIPKNTAIVNSDGLDKNVRKVRVYLVNIITFWQVIYSMTTNYFVYEICYTD